MPGLTASRPRWRSVYCATCTGSVGRGPISDISPRSTLTQVRQLVERRAAQERADARDARVVRVDREPGADVLGAVDHRAQLEHVERRAVQPERRWR